MVYRPGPSVTAERTFSINAGLEASTVTPGTTAPVLSRTWPEMLPAMFVWLNELRAEHRTDIPTRTNTGASLNRMPSSSHNHAIKTLSNLTRFSTIGVHATRMERRCQAASDRVPQQLGSATAAPFLDRP